MQYGRIFKSVLDVNTNAWERTVCVSCVDDGGHWFSSESVQRAIFQVIVRIMQIVDRRKVESVDG